MQAQCVFILLSSFRTLDEDSLLEALEERGLVEQVVKTLNLSRVSQTREEQSPSYGGVVGREEGEGEREREEGEREEERENESPAGSPQHLHHRLSSPGGKKSSVYMYVAHSGSYDIGSGVNRGKRGSKVYIGGDGHKQQGTRNGDYCILVLILKF